MARNTLLDYSNKWEKFEIYTNVNRYPTLGMVIISLSTVKKKTESYKVYGKAREESKNRLNLKTSLKLYASITTNVY